MQIATETNQAYVSIDMLPAFHAMYGAQLLEGLRTKQIILVLQMPSEIQ